MANSNHWFCAETARNRCTTSDFFDLLFWVFPEMDWPGWSQPSPDCIDVLLCDIDDFAPHLGDPCALVPVDEGAVALWVGRGWRLEIERTNRGHKGYTFRCEGAPELDLYVEDDWDAPGTFTPFHVDVFVQHLTRCKERSA